MKKRLLVLLLIGTMLVVCASCNLKLLGKWRITEVAAGDVVMSKEDIDEMGLDPGFIKLNKSGSCVVNLLADDYEGSWTQSDANNITITYGEGLSGTATIEAKTMTFTDSQGAVYTLEK